MKYAPLWGSVAILALAASGCSAKASSKDDVVGKVQSAATSAAAQSGDGGQADGSSGGNSGASICESDSTPGTQALFIGLQLLAQPSLDLVMSVRKGEALGPALDIDGLNEGIQEYRVLDGHPATGFKDPKVVLDKWQDLSDKMGAMIDAPGDPTQADIDSYTAAMGDQQELIMSQLDVAMAKDSYCGS